MVELELDPLEDDDEAAVFDGQALSLEWEGERLVVHTGGVSATSRASLWRGTTIDDRL